MIQTIKESIKPFKEERIRLRRNKFTSEAKNNKIREKFSVNNLLRDEFMWRNCIEKFVKTYVNVDLFFLLYLHWII